MMNLNLSRASVLTVLFALLLTTALTASCRYQKDQPPPAPAQPAETLTTPADQQPDATPAPVPPPPDHQATPTPDEPAPAEVDLELPSVPAKLPRTGPAKFTIIYTTSISGELLDCGCPKHPRGGLAKRARIVEDRRETTPALVQFDAGNALFPYRQGSAQVAPALKDKAKVIARAMGKLKVDVANVGIQDLAAGLDFLKDQARANDLSYVSANLLDPQTGHRLFAPFKLVEVQGVRIGVIGLIEPRMVRSTEVKAEDPAKVAPLLIRHLKPSCDMIVLLYAGGYLPASKLAKEAPGIDLIIAADRAGTPSNRPLVVGDSIVTQGGNRGMYVGVFNFTLLVEAKSMVSEQEKEVMKRRLDLLQAQLAVTSGPVMRDPEVKKIHDRAAAEAQQIQGQIANTISKLDYTNEVISVDADLPEDPEIAEWVKAAE